MLAYDRLRLMNLFHNSRRVMLCFQIARRRRLRQYIVSAVYRRNVIWLTRHPPITILIAVRSRSSAISGGGC